MDKRELKHLFMEQLAKAKAEKLRPKTYTDWSDMGDGYEQRLVIRYNSVSVKRRLKKQPVKQDKKEGEGNTIPDKNHE